MAPVVPQTALVTGATKGIGEATALLLDRLGWRVFAGCRSGEGAAALAARASARLRTVPLEVTDEASIAAAAVTVEEASPEGLGALVNNAGLALAGPLEALPLAEVRYQLEVNTIGLVAVTQALLPAVRRARGRIVNVSSINGRLATPWVAPYCASKFAVEALSDSLRVELRPWGIEVVLIEPGAIATPIWASAAERGRVNLERLRPGTRDLYRRLIDKMMTGAGRPPRHAIPAERVARVIARALAAGRPRTRYRVGLDARAGALAAHLPDRLRDRLLSR